MQQNWTVLIGLNKPPVVQARQSDNRIPLPVISSLR